ncbi:unnamed protein product, partial [Callosobruchus maculatus]
SSSDSLPANVLLQWMQLLRIRLPAISGCFIIKCSLRHLT